MPTTRPTPEWLARQLEAGLRPALGQGVTVRPDPLVNGYVVERLAFDRYTGERLLQRYVIDTETLVGGTETYVVAITRLFLEADPVEQEIRRRVTAAIGHARSMELDREGMRFTPPDYSRRIGSVNYSFPVRLPTSSSVLAESMARHDEARQLDQLFTPEKPARAEKPKSVYDFLGE